MLKEDTLTLVYPGRTQRLSEGVFWFFVAATLLLALLDAYVHMQASPQLSLAWAGVFVLYYVLRFPLTQPRWRFSVPPALFLDLLIIACLVVLSGGWRSPLALLYLGWAATLLDVASLPMRLGISGLACGAFVFGVLLAPHPPFSSLQLVLLSQQAVLLMLVLMGINGFKLYGTHVTLAWEAERGQWDALRQTVFAQLSHELYTPLSAISASAALLAAVESPSVERRAVLLRIIERNCARMNILVDDLLALWREPERQVAYAPQCLRCVPIAESVGQMLDPLLMRDRQWLEISAEPQDVSVLAKRQWLEQVLVNLLSNAQKFGPADAAITLTISSLGHEVLFAMHDEGEGVPPEEQRRLFDVFYRGTNSPAALRGSGIGLALVKTLVTMQRGRLWVESMPGSGCTFYFTLPAVDSG
jgi:signal transduction histidine kinase